MKGSVFLLFVVELIQTTSAWIVRRQVVPPAPPPSKFFRLESSVVGASDLLLPEPVIAPTLVPEPMRRRSPGEVFKQAFAKYDTLCKEKPLRTKSVTSAVISALGSVVSQTLMAVVKGKPAVINPNTVLAFFLTGLLYIGPFYHYWYEQLWTMGGWMERRYRSSPQTQTLAQIGVDQTIGVLAFFPIYFYVYEIFEALAFGRAPLLLSAHRKCVTTLSTALLANWRVWPLINYVNFRYVPASMRVLAMNAVSVCWNAFFCTLMA